MEIKRTIKIRRLMVHFVLWTAFTLMGDLVAFAQQPVKKYTVKEGKMFIEMSKDIREAVLDSFILQFNLGDIGLKQFIRRNNFDSLGMSGWAIEHNGIHAVVISKPLQGFDPLKTPGDKMTFSDKPNFAAEFPAVSNRVVFGNNRFRNKSPFTMEHSVVRFFLRGQEKARNVMLAGSFNDWDPKALSMTRTDSGWIANVKLAPGKYWYKFIVDGQWIVDRDNALMENDGRGNVNSIFFRTNMVFRLEGFTGARRVYVSGSFNNWKHNDLAMVKTASGWELPLYLAEGTHAYKFVVDGKWYADEKNPDHIPDGLGAYNSVIRLGTPYVFRLQGHTDAKEVVVAGSFNNWRDFEHFMKKTATGWELPITLGPGNYEYKFRVDGKWITDPAKDVQTDQKNQGNSYLILKPNYTFRLKGHSNAQKVFLAGDFNNWNPTAYPMRKEGNEWVFPMHLSPGKVRYKFVVDGQWILDPGNKLWEQNEHRTGNSILWIEQ